MTLPHEPECPITLHNIMEVIGLGGSRQRYTARPLPGLRRRLGHASLSLAQNALGHPLEMRGKLPSARYTLGALAAKQSSNPFIQSPFAHDPWADAPQKILQRRHLCHEILFRRQWYAPGAPQ